MSLVNIGFVASAREYENGTEAIHVEIGGIPLLIGQVMILFPRNRFLKAIQNVLMKYRNVLTIGGEDRPESSPLVYLGNFMVTPFRSLYSSKKFKF